MIQKSFKIGNIPAILYGKPSDKLFIAVHGNMSNKSDDIILLFASEVVEKGYQMLSFDLPEHGERKEDKAYPCKIQNCIKDLGQVMEYAKSLSKNISLFACSQGAYFSLVEYENHDFDKCLFLSPVIDMEKLIENLMNWLQISKEELKEKQEIKTKIGITFYWDYYCFVKEHKITKWNNDTSILYGKNDNIVEFKTVSDFANKFNCDLKVMEKGEHYFHTKEHLEYFKAWLKDLIKS
ncbi:MAG: Alpha/beta hydrolase family protein [Alphaproteobacteria bacterium ADurb.Bin438]|nr:MAG: Alpha/beta hydrolase family protein [Alphaproteobacteria bacterium ADurb.Bin438]